MTTATESPASTQAMFESLPERLIRAMGGEPQEGILVVDTDDRAVLDLPAGTVTDLAISLGEDLILLQPDGTAMVLLGGMESRFELTVGDVTVPLETVQTLALERPLGESGDLEIGDDLQALFEDVVGFVPPAPLESINIAARNLIDPLVGLEISPLLLYTEYGFGPATEEESSPDEASPPPAIEVSAIGNAALTETDSGLSFLPANYLLPVIPDPGTGETVTQVGLVLTGLPVGTTASAGTLTVSADGSLSLAFSGSLASYAALVVTFPPDFSTEQRSDLPGLAIEATVTATSNFGDAAPVTVPVTIAVEGDVEIAGNGPAPARETDAAVLLRLADTYTPQATDADGSERVTQVALTLVRLPDGALVSTDGGASFSSIPAGVLDLVLTPAEYDALILSFPPDFSTQNPTSAINGRLTAVTDEGGRASVPISIEIAATPDLAISAPATVSADEDALSGDGSGVIVDLQIDVAVSDQDGSEDATTVSLTFTDLPAGAFARVNGTDTPILNDTWTGTIAEAQGMSLGLPGDYSGSIGVAIVATSPEGSASTAQTVTITPAGDVDIDIFKPVLSETDAPVSLAPASVWTAQPSDADGSEVITGFSLSLVNLPPDMTFSGVPAASIAYDATTGDFAFTGSPAEYAALILTFPADFSTVIRNDARGPISGTLTVTSNEGANAAGVSVTIDATDDLVFAGPGTISVVETDAPIDIAPWEVLRPRQADADGSESVDLVTFTLPDLPGGTAISVDGGATFTPLGGATLNFSGTLAQYEELVIRLPADFSTTNPNIPLNGTLRATTDEGGDQTRAMEFSVAFSEDIDLTVPAVVTVSEDGGAANSDQGVVVDLSLDIVITDRDGSEDAATVTIDFTDLPAGASARIDGTSTPITGNRWTGTVAEANDLHLGLPGNFSGTVGLRVTVDTPEGSETAQQTVIVSPVPDIAIGGSILVTENDPAPTMEGLEVRLSDFISVTIGDPGEALISAGFDLAGLPGGTRLVDGAGNSYDQFFTPNGGTLDLSYLYVAGTSAENPADLRLILPDDYSTENPAQSLTAVIEVVTTDGINTASIPFVVRAEGDVAFRGSGAISLTETDAPISFKPADALVGVPTDSDGSEAVASYAVSIAGLPVGTRVSSDDGATFTPLVVIPGQPSASYTATLTPAQYDALVIELPADFSTDSPGPRLTGSVTVTTDEAAVVNGVATGVATETFTVTVGAEGDVALTTDIDLALSENDGPSNRDGDTTTTAPLAFAPRDAVLAAPTDADGSESISAVAIAVSGLPAGTRVSQDGGNTFAPLPGSGFAATGLTLAQYEGLVFRLPDDFSTETPASTIAGTVTFGTDEGGSVSGSFGVTVSAEADIALKTATVNATEDQGAPTALGLDATITDPDGSEVFNTVTVSFTGLPATGNVTLSDGARTYALNPGTPSLTIAPADLPNLAITGLPLHYAGILSGTLSATTNEGGPVSAAFDVRVAPVAESVISLSVDSSQPQVTEVVPDQFSVKEDTSFRLTISASTPDNADGSEALTKVVVENVPTGWLPQGTVLTRFEAGLSEITTAILSGTTLTITLRPGVTSLDAALRVTPSPNSDSDVATLRGSDLRATVTSVDTASGLPSSTVTASDTTNVDLDAVVDGINLTVRDTVVSENTNGRRASRLRIDTLSLKDADGSEGFDQLDLTLTVTTATTGFDLTDAAQSGDVRLEIGGGLASKVMLTEMARSANTLDFTLTPAPGATSSEFAAALQQLRVNVAQHFSGIIENEGEIFWSETRTGDAEADTSDNFASRTFEAQITVRPVAEADMTFAVFVRSAGAVTGASPVRIEGTVADGSSTVGNILTLLESTDDGSGPGQVSLFLELDLATPDTDGSEDLESLTIENVPSHWIAGDVTGSLVGLSAFFAADGSAAIGAAEWSKVNVAIYDIATGTLTVFFVPGTTEFEAAIRLQPGLYEDYDVSPGRDYADPAADPSLSTAGIFFGGDLKAALRTRDTNTVTTDTESSDVTLDVDVAPVNNIAIVPPIAAMREDVVDAAGGTFQAAIFPFLPDTDGSETITAVLLRDLDPGLVPYANDPDAPGGSKIPVALHAINGNGSNDWSIGVGPDPTNPLWTSLELRGIDRHFAGDIPLVFDVVTTERDGGGTRVSQQIVVARIDPVPDGGDPSETFTTVEDVAVAITIDGNIIDNSGTSPGSPESLIDSLRILGIAPDADGRAPRFFEGMPVADPNTPGAYLNELFPDASGTLTVAPFLAGNLHVLPPEDSNRDLALPIEVTYQEDIDPSRTLSGTGTLSIRVTGVADRPTATVQVQDPAEVAGGIDTSTIHPDFRPGDDLQPGTGDDTGTLNSARVYAYAGYEGTNFGTRFALDQRVSDAFLQSGLPPGRGSNIFVAAEPLGGDRTEGNAPTPRAQDGSETIYYLISGFDPSVQVIGASPADTTGHAFIVTASQLDGLRISAVNRTGEKVAYHDLSMAVIVQEDDARIPDLRGLSPAQRLAALDALDGIAVTERDFSLMILDFQGGSGDGTDPRPPGSPRDIGFPVLALTGTGNEDEPIALTLELTPGGAYNSLQDLLNLPRGVAGSLSVSIDLPAGATLSGATPGTVLYNPVTGQYLIDLAKLIRPGDTTSSSGELAYTPPAHQSSPANPFDPSETFGPADPYDNLQELEIGITLQNATVRKIESATVSSHITVNPVADGPSITLDDPGTVLEDTSFELGASISGMDGGERLAPGAPILVEVDARNGGRLLDASGAAVSPVTTRADGFAVYEISAAELSSVRVAPGPFYSGPLTYRVTATSQDIDGSTASATQSRTVQIEAVANIPEFTSILPGPTPVYTAVEDQPFDLSSVLQAASPDRDGSEVTTFAQLGVPTYLDVAAGPGITNNGDGTYTILPKAFPTLRLQLKEEHARTPNGFDPAIPAQIPLALGMNVLELSNGSTATRQFDFLLRVIPDADAPTLTTAAAQTLSVAEDGPPVVLTLEATTLDPHETLDFILDNLPIGTTVTVGGVATIVTTGSFVIAGRATSVAGTTPVVFGPAGEVAISPPLDYAGPLDIAVLARTTDAGSEFVDTEDSSTITLNVTVTETPDLAVTVLDPADTIVETNAALTYVPSSNVTLVVMDSDGSEAITTVAYALSGLPETASLGAASVGATLTGGVLTFSGTEAQFHALSVVFPADYSTNGRPDMTASITVATNEGGLQTETFTLAIDGAPDVDPTASAVDHGVLTALAEIDGFRLEGGDDLIDLSGARTGYPIDGGSGNDRFDAGSALPAWPDVITDHEAGEVIDLSGLLRLQTAGTVGTQVELDGRTLKVTDISASLHDLFGITDSGGGVPESVTVAFEDAASLQQTALV